jgi:hypothetical protein
MCSMSGHPACPGRAWVARDGQRPHECSGRAVSSLTGPETTPCWSMTVYGVRVWCVMEQPVACCRYTDTAPCCSDYRSPHSVTSTECGRQQSEWCGAVVVYLQHRQCRFCAESRFFNHSSRECPNYSHNEPVTRLSRTRPKISHRA